MFPGLERWECYLQNCSWLRSTSLDKNLICWKSLTRVIYKVSVKHDINVTAQVAGFFLIWLYIVYFRNLICVLKRCEEFEPNSLLNTKVFKGTTKSRCFRQKVQFFNLETVFQAFCYFLTRKQFHGIGSVTEFPHTSRIIGTDLPKICKYVIP